MTEPRTPGRTGAALRMVGIASAAALAGCALTADYQRPVLDLPAQWPDTLQAAQQLQGDWTQWWQRYEDPALTQLVDDALAANLDLRAAAARVRRARAELGFTRADQYPTLNAQADVVRGDTGQTTSAADGPVTRYRIAGVLAYELDLWGRLAQATEAARGRWLQTTFGADAVRLALITDVVTAYFNLRALDRQIRTTQDTIATRNEAYRLEQVNYRNGATTELTLRQSEAELALAEAQLPALQNRAGQVRRTLAILTGRPPSQVLQPPALPTVALRDLTLDTRLPKLLPSELIERRPDIRAAEAGLMAAQADISVARTAWLPRINLAGTIGSAATDADALFTGPAQLWDLGGSVLAPLLDFGRIRAGVDVAEAQRDLAELQYRASIRDALREAGDAWTLLETASRRLEALTRQVGALQAAVRLAETRYRNGYSPFFEVLDARRSLLAAELAQTEAVRDRLIATALLFKALGGGWREPCPDCAAGG